MATEPHDMEDGLGTAISRARRRLAASGTHRASATGVYESPLDPEERSAVLALLRDGTYREASRRVGNADPDVADI